ncbi:aldo/keto reductase [Pelagibacterium montanilacus]|uniref:aldo/keto reductase n=1 Tax=Pelagibacterium montanilacus TaxID=2185280 RepID=UPI000F8C4B6A|nr:aldo/keto reductase [Pelagibacterium montanilacus]
MIAKRPFGRTGWDVTEISLGCGTHVEDWNAEEERNFSNTVHHALDMGMNFFDTADSYNTEEWLGKALGASRSDVLVSTKVGKFAQGTGHALSYAIPEHVLLCCDASLGRLKTDVIDLYICHLDPPDDVDVFLEAFSRLKQQGKIRHFGASTNKLDVLKAMNRDGDCAACQLDYNMLDRQPEADIFPYCRENGIATIIRRPLDKGILSGRLTADQTFTDWVRKRWNQGAEREAYQRKIAQVEELKDLETPERTLVQAAIQFVLANSDVSCTIPGASRPDRLDDYIGALQTSLSAQDQALIDRVSAPRAF